MGDDSGCFDPRWIRRQLLSTRPRALLRRNDSFLQRILLKED
jgi:hypothetical protein